MTETSKAPEINNVTQIDDFRVRRLEESGNYYGILDRFDLLTVKFYGGEILDTEEARDFILYTKYLMKNGHSDALQERCRQIFTKHIEPNEL